MSRATQGTATLRIAVLFTFPSRYWFAIGLLRVFSLGGWARRIHTGFLVSRATQGTATLRITSCTGLSPSPRYSGFRYASHDFVYWPITIYGETFQILPLVMYLAMSRPYNPIHAVTRMVWALPRSLATTGGIIVIFSSCRY